jgi:hypothetical protein
MRWFGEFSVTWWPGAIGFLVCAGVLWLRWMTYARSVPPATDYAELLGLTKMFFASADAYGAWSSRRVGMLTLGLGLTSMASVLIGDSVAGAPCREACRTSGWDGGRLRGNPHESASGGYECWCQSDGAWSPEPVAVTATGSEP